MENRSLRKALKIPDAVAHGAAGLLPGDVLGYFISGRKAGKEETMRLIVVTLVVVMALCMATSAKAAELGRYQGVSISAGPGRGGSGVLILDTKDGDFWLWESTPSGTHLMYQGQVKPGKEPGEVLFETQRQQSRFARPPQPITRPPEPGQKPKGM